MSEEIKKQKPDNKTTNQDYEIDLGSLFIGMGNKISNLFNGIINLVKSFFKSLILFIIFIKKNFVKLVIVSAIGMLIGFSMDYFRKTEDTFETSMTLSPNFGSTLQLYKSVEMFQSMIDLQNYELLSTKLNITLEEAQSLVSFSVEPYVSELDKVVAYRTFLSKADSITAQNYSFDNYFKTIAVEDFSNHIISVIAKKNDIFSKLKEPILISIISNKYFADIKETSYKNLLAKRENLNVSKGQLDSLRVFYKKIMVLNAKRTASGTNIFMAESEKTQDKELIVFNKYMDLNDELLAVTRDIINEREIVNVVSDFNEVGSKTRPWFIYYSILGLIFGIGLGVFGLLIIEFNKWLQRYIDTNIKE